MMSTKRRSIARYLGIACISSLGIHLALASVATANAEDKPGEEISLPDALKAYQELSEPGPEHKKLAMMVGNWKIDSTVYTAPDAPPTKSEATASVRALMGGRYFRETYKGEMMGLEFSGIGMFGYDKGMKKYVSTWLDSMSTGLMHSEGTADASGDVITYTGQYFDPLRQTIVKTKYVLTIKNRKTHSAVMYEIAADGSEHKGMELVYTRAARADGAKKQGAKKQGAKKQGAKNVKKDAE
jgi:hypothetical protein